MTNLTHPSLVNHMHRQYRLSNRLLNSSGVPSFLLSCLLEKANLKKYIFKHRSAYSSNIYYVERIPPCLVLSTAHLLYFSRAKW